MAALLQVENLLCTFGGVHAVDGASFEVAAGTVVGLIGPNGAGKSTAISAIAGAIRAQAGRVVFCDREIQGLPPHKIAHRGLIRTFQHSSEFGSMTVMENMLAAQRHAPGASITGLLRGRRSWAAAEASAVKRARLLIERFELADKENQLAASLSGGQKRLLELARALMAEPTMLILDEPLAGVNPALAQRIVPVLQELRSQGITILIVEHDLPLVERLCDIVIVMSIGKVISIGRMEDLRKQREVVDAYLAR